MTALNPAMRIGAQVAEAITRARLVGLACDARPRAPSNSSTRSGSRRRRDARPRLPAPALRRDAPAGDHRDGAGEPPACAHRRRAHHRARRHHAGADPRAARQHRPRPGPRGRPRDPRSGRGGRSRRPGDGHVRGQGRRGGHGRRRVRVAAAPVHRGLLRRCRTVSRGARRAHRHPGLATESPRPCRKGVRVPLRVVLRHAEDRCRAGGTHRSASWRRTTERRASVRRNCDETLLEVDGVVKHFRGARRGRGARGRRRELRRGAARRSRSWASRAAGSRRSRGCCRLLEPTPVKPTSTARPHAPPRCARAVGCRWCSRTRTRRSTPA